MLDDDSECIIKRTETRRKIIATLIQKKGNRTPWSLGRSYKSI